MSFPRPPHTLTRFATLALVAATVAQAGPGGLHGASGAGFHGASMAEMRGGASVGAVRGGYGPVSRGIYGGFRGGPGRSLRVLPMGCVSYRYGGSPWFYGGGIWYRPWGLGYAAFYPPVGLALAMLPFGYLTYYYGGIPYYWYQDVYYVDAPSGGYQVAAPPAGDPYPQAAPPPPAPSGAASPNNAPSDALLIIPKEGQNEQKMMADRQNAQRYAMDESGFDPARSDPNDPGTPRARRAYFRAMKSYLEERGYSVK
jgi:hypothetical protein